MIYTTNGRFVADVKAADVTLTSLQGFLPAMTYAEVAGLFGPHNSEGDDYKVSTEWVIRDTLTNCAIIIYDYKATCLYNGRYPSVQRFRTQKYEWHVGARGAAEASELIRWVKRYWKPTP